MYTVTMMDAVAANANLTTTATIYEYPYGLNGVKQTCDKGNVSLEVIATGTDGANGVVKIQQSDNGTTFSDVDSSYITITAAGTYPFTFSNAAKKYYRLDYAKGANTIGTITATLTFN